MSLGLDHEAHVLGLGNEGQVFYSLALDSEICPC